MLIVGSTSFNFTNSNFTVFQDSDDPMAHIHFMAEGEVTFKSILFVPTSAPRGLFDEYGSKKNDYIKVCPSSRICLNGLYQAYRMILKNSLNSVAE